MNNMKEIKLGDNIKVYVSGGKHKEEIEKDFSDLIMNNFKNALKENNEKDLVNINNTFHVDKPKGEVSYENKGGCKMKVKEQPNEEKIIRDKMEQFKRGNKVKIVQGDFKALKDKECTFLEYCKTLNKVLIQLDEINPLYVNPLDIKLVRKAITQYDIKYSKELSNIASVVIIDDVVVKNRGDEKLNLLVQTGDKIRIYSNDKINIISYYQIINSLGKKAKENIKVIKCWEEK